MDIEMQKGKTCLVLGANGFIGSHIVDRLVQDGYTVIAFDRFSNEPRYNPHGNIKQVKGDIFNLLQVVAEIKNADYVFHCFSATTPSSSDNDPYIDVTQNLLNNIRIFEACAIGKIKKVVFISSGGVVYGDGNTKEDGATLPVSPYGIAKLASERYLAYFNKKYDLHYIVYRLSNPYGPRQITKHNQGVIPRFLHQIMHNEPITMYGDGTSSRDYIYIEDASRMIVKSFSQKAKHTVYNLGSGVQTPLLEIVRTIEHLCGKKAVINNQPAPDTFVKHAVLDTERLEKEFKLKAEVDFSVGVSKTLAHLSADQSDIVKVY